MSVVVAIAVGGKKSYTENWAADLGTDTITNAAWSFNLPGPIITDTSNTSTTTTVVIQAPPAPGRVFYDLTCVVTTASGLTLPKTFVVEIVTAEYI